MARLLAAKISFRSHRDMVGCRRTFLWRIRCFLQIAYCQDDRFAERARFQQRSLFVEEQRQYRAHPHSRETVFGLHRSGCFSQPCRPRGVDAATTCSLSGDSREPAVCSPLHGGHWALRVRHESPPAELPSYGRAVFRKSWTSQRCRFRKRGCGPCNGVAGALAGLLVRRIRACAGRAAGQGIACQL